MDNTTLETTNEQAEQQQQLTIFQQLERYFNEQNRQAYHDGFVMGARTYHHLVQEQGATPENALKSCEGHKFFVTAD